MALAIGGASVYSGKVVFERHDTAHLSPDLTARQIRRLTREAVVEFVAPDGVVYNYDVAGMAAAVAEVQRCRLAPPAPPTNDLSPKRSSIISSGSGFYVSSEGHILTSAHVVAGCDSATISLPGSEPERVSILVTDTHNDLAILLSKRRPKSVPALRPGIRMGEPVASFGYPLADLLPSSGNFSMGHITATAGLRDNPRQLQISTPIQPGNSGGPVLDMKGNVVGIVASTLIARLTKDVPQNVNFAIKADIVIDFLGANNVPRVRELREVGQLDPVDLATAASEVSMHIRCASVPTHEPTMGK